MALLSSMQTTDTPFAPVVVDQSVSPRSLPWPVMALLVVACALLLWQLGTVPLFDVDEPRYARTAVEMMQRQDWITPYFNGKVRFDKPVFYYWFIAASYQMFGISEWSARLTSALATVITAGGVWLGCRKLAPTLAPIFSLVFLTCLMVIGIGRMSITDMTLTMWMTLTTLTAFYATLPCQQRWWLLAGVFAGFGMLTKGPVALALPGLVVLLTTLWQGRFKATFCAVWPWLGVVLAVAIAAPWYWACYNANGWAFIDALLLHNVTRFEGVVSGHKQPWFFYTLVLFAGSFPWGLSLPWAWQTVWQHRRSTMPLDVLAQFALIWLMTVFVFFQVAQTKLLTYLLPLFPAVAILVGYHWYRASTGSLLWPLRLTLILTAALTLTMGFLGLDRFLPNEAAGIGVNSAVWWVGLSLTAGLALAERLMAKHARLLSLTALSGGWLLAVGLTITLLLPAIGQVTHAPVREVRDYVAQFGNVPVATYQLQRTSLTYYLDKPVPSLIYLGQLDSYLRQLPANGLVLTKQRFRTRLQQRFPQCGIIRQSRVYVLFNCEKP
jgi:4-amino-4-deoxy-L-arabinose transferase-like glycosyltransferase